MQGKSFQENAENYIKLLFTDQWDTSACAKNDITARFKYGNSYNLHKTKIFQEYPTAEAKIIAVVKCAKTV